MAEIFEDQAAFDKHQTRAKASAWFELTRSIPREYNINVGSAPQI